VLSAGLSRDITKNEKTQEKKEKSKEADENSLRAERTRTSPNQLAAEPDVRHQVKLAVQLGPLLSPWLAAHMLNERPAGRTSRSAARVVGGPGQIADGRRNHRQSSGWRRQYVDATGSPGPLAPGTGSSGCTSGYNGGSVSGGVPL